MVPNLDILHDDDPSLERAVTDTPECFESIMLHEWDDDTQCPLCIIYEAIQICLQGESKDRSHIEKYAEIALFFYEKYFSSNEEILHVYLLTCDSVCCSVRSHEQYRLCFENSSASEHVSGITSPSSSREKLKILICHFLLIFECLTVEIHDDCIKEISQNKDEWCSWINTSPYMDGTEFEIVRQRLLSSWLWLDEIERESEHNMSTEIHQGTVASQSQKVPRSLSVLVWLLRSWTACIFDAFVARLDNQMPRSIQRDWCKAYLLRIWCAITPHIHFDDEVCAVHELITKLTAFFPRLYEEELGILLHISLISLDQMKDPEGLEQKTESEQCFILRNALLHTCHFVADEYLSANENFLVDTEQTENGNHILPNVHIHHGEGIEKLRSIAPEGVKQWGAGIVAVDSIISDKPQSKETQMGEGPYHESIRTHRVGYTQQMGNTAEFENGTTQQPPRHEQRSCQNSTSVPTEDSGLRGKNPQSKYTCDSADHLHLSTDKTFICCCIQ